MHLFQHHIVLPAKSRGFHLITAEIIRALPELRLISNGLCQIFIQHTSASLTINENADPTVRKDLEMYFNKSVPENEPDYRHRSEGPDDMPAHVKSVLLGNSVLIPVSEGALQLGQWQGIYLGEHRDHASPRSLVCTLWGNSPQN
jgi:secondary thiamine-phosphate synthase enzyme